MGRAGISCEHIRIFNCGRVCTCCFQRRKLYFYDTKQTINSTPKQHGQEQDNERVTHTQTELGIELSWSLGRVSSLQGLMSIRMLIFMQIFADRFRPGMGGFDYGWRDGVGNSVVSGVCVRVWRFVYFPVVGATVCSLLWTQAVGGNKLRAHRRKLPAGWLWRKLMETLLRR